jgi:hypothetical protein
MRKTNKLRRREYKGCYFSTIFKACTGCKVLMELIVTSKTLLIRKKSQ